MRTIIVEHYNPLWPGEFEKIRAYLWPHISDIALDIVHAGSTSVPGLAAKPIIDFNIIIESYDVFPQLVERLRTLGYGHEGDGDIPMRERFKGGLRDGFMEYHMYVCPKDSPELERQILFRDYLRGHDDARNEYAALKQSLAEKHRHDIDAYIAGKHEFIMNIVALVRKQGVCEQTQNIYDNPVFFDGYKKLRENPNNANLLEEKPALFSLSPELTGKTVLDLGCGYGENCAEIKRLGAVRVTGIDISEKMLAVARAETSDIEYLRADMNDLPDISERYDVAFSSLAVHYVVNFSRLCAQVSGLLRDGGYLIFSQEHPLTTAPLKGVSWTKNEAGQRIHYNLSDYARSGRREMTWIVDGVIKYHRTFSEIFNALTSNGFVVEKVLEPIPDEEAIKRLPNFESELHKPNFLLIRARKERVTE